MHAPEPLARIYRPLGDRPTESFTKGWRFGTCTGGVRQRTIAELEADYQRSGSGGNCFDRAYWLLVTAREAGVAARVIGHHFEAWEAHAAVILTDDAGHEYLCDPGDCWMQPVLISPESPDFGPGYHEGFFPAAAVRIERTDQVLTVHYRRQNGKESEQHYDLSPVEDQAFLRACHHSQQLLRRPFAERLLTHPETGEVGLWEFDRGRSFWSLPGGLVEEPPCESLAEWVDRIAERTGLAPSVVQAGFATYHAHAR